MLIECVVSHQCSHIGYHAADTSRAASSVGQGGPGDVFIAVMVEQRAETAVPTAGNKILKTGGTGGDFAEGLMIKGNQIFATNPFRLLKRSLVEPAACDAARVGATVRRPDHH